MNEQWRDIEGSPGYAVSDCGRVTSPSGRVLKPQSNGKYGYLFVYLTATRREYVHRLVAAAFIGPANGYEVDHRNGDVSDNTLTNLRYLTHAQNLAAQRERKYACQRGHSFADAYWGPNGRRQCRTCRQIADRRRRPPKGKVTAIADYNTTQDGETT